MRVNGAKLGGTWKDENTPKLNSYTVKRLPINTHKPSMGYLRYIYQHEWLILMVHVCRQIYRTPPMEHQKHTPKLNKWRKMISSKNQHLREFPGESIRSTFLGPVFFFGSNCLLDPGCENAPTVNVFFETIATW